MLFGRKDHRLSVLPGILSAVLPAAIVLLSLLATAVDTAVLPQTADISASAAGSSGSAGGWEVSHTAQLPVSVLTAISCPATGDCVAVGQGSSGNAIAAVTSNGGLDWTLQQLPSKVGSLAGISCPTTQACFAVGQASEPYNSTTSGGIVVSTSDGGSSWSVQDIPGGVASLTGISCAISSDCWAVGNNTASVPVMLSTADGGTTWTATAPPAPAGNLYAISCSTTTSCVATGAGGTVVFTSDGGKTWTAPPVPDDTVNLDSVSCADAMFCMAVSAPPYFNNLPLPNGISRMSRISGISRASVSSPVDTFAGSTSATGSSTDMASAPVWVTTDGGATWTTQQPLASIVGLAGVSCVPTSSTAITGTASTAYTPCTAIGMEVTSGTLDNPITENVVVLASTDGGSIWNTEDTSSSTVNLLAISCNNSTDCITVGAESPNTSTTLLPPLLGTSEIGIALSTTDGGSAWNLTDVPTTSQVLLDVNCASTTSCMAVGSTTGTGGSTAALALFTSNGGQTWMSENPPANAPLLDVSCPTTTQCTAVGGNPIGGIFGSGAATILSTYNGGSSWTSGTIPGNLLGILGVSCASVTFCVSVGAGYSSNAKFGSSLSNIAGIILVSTDGGALWKEQAAYPEDILSSVSCPTISTCYASGTSILGFQGFNGLPGMVVKTVNGGSTWSVLEPAGKDTPELNGIACPSATQCVVSGGSLLNNLEGGGGTSGGLGFTTTDGGAEWSRSTFPSGSQPVMRISCANTQDCWAASGELFSPSSGGILASTDGGVQWTEQTLPVQPLSMFGVSCPSAVGCYATGLMPSQSMVLSTTTGGWLMPTINSISPSGGFSYGGTTVTLSGAGFVQGRTVVNFGTVPSPSVVVQSSSELTAVSPPESGTVSVTIQTPGGTTAPTSQITFSYQQAASYTSGIASSFTPVTPYRIADTRPGSGEPYAGQTLGTGSVLSIKIGGTQPQGSGNGIPISATAAVINVTAVNAASSGYLTVWPTGYSKSISSVVNYSGTAPVANLVTVPIGLNGQVNVYASSGQVDVVMDAEGWYGPTGTSSFTAINPYRIADTRPGSGEPYAGDTLAPDSTLTIKAIGTGTIPANGVTAVDLNVTAVNAASSGYLTVWPTDQARPLASTVNFSIPPIVSPVILDGNPAISSGPLPVSNSVAAEVSPSGEVNIYNSSHGSINVVVDVQGWFSTPGSTSTSGSSPSQFTPVNPYRIADTRSGSGEPYAGQTIAPHGVLTVKVGGTTPLGNTNSGAGVPITATAVVLNVTVATSDASGYLTVWPAGLARPLASSINYGNIDSGNGTIIASQVIVPLGSGGGISIYNPSGYTNVVVDVEGWF
ncbi:MAG: IPT/TIG domain-containing protein [Actinobacteria bacterium]|nr:IPT/TIG domain-containing protein [Actinomycetota bacterium]